ncbi:MAG: hypothetical protein U5K51_03790 [Flavobacteriaceae bacterium]|nr:hypothetical protein [Flavobacteriaceae bacterium]
MNNKDNLLNFCLTNVYEKLSEVDFCSKLNKSIEENLVGARILYLLDYETLDARKYLIELFKTTLISREIVDATDIEEVYYYIPDFAKEYLSQKHPVDRAYIKKITSKSRN